MNAVEAAEQLITVGHQMQQLEQHLCTPMVDLATWVTWHNLLIDPADRLADLLTIEQPPHSAPPSVNSVYSPTAFPWDTPPAIASPPMINQPKLDVPVVEATHTADMTRASLTDDYPSDTHTPSHLTQPPQPATPRLRLTRDRSSLLSILNANVQSRSPSASSSALPPSDTQSTLPPTKQTSSAELSNSSHVQPSDENIDVYHNRSGNDSQVGDSQHHIIEQPKRAIVSASTESASTQSTPARNEMQPDDFMAQQEMAQTESPSVTAVNASPAEMPNINGIDTNLESRTDRNPGNDNNALADRRESNISPGNLSQQSDIQAINHQNGQHGPTQADTGSINVENTMPPTPIDKSPPLSDAQIEQVLNALDERLELMLLRTYGTSSP